MSQDQSQAAQHCKHNWQYQRTAEVTERLLMGGSMRVSYDIYYCTHCLATTRRESPTRSRL